MVCRREVRTFLNILKLDAKTNGHGRDGVNGVAVDHSTVVGATVIGREQA